MTEDRRRLLVGTLLVAGCLHLTRALRTSASRVAVSLDSRCWCSRMATLIESPGGDEEMTNQQLRTRVRELVGSGDLPSEPPVVQNAGPG